MAFTAPTTRATDFLVTAAVWNAEHVDNFNTAVMHLIARRTTDQSVTSSVVLVDDNTLILPVGANEVWKNQWQIRVASPAAGDYRIGWTWPTAGELGWDYTYEAVGGTATRISEFDGTSPSVETVISVNVSASLLVCIDTLYVGGANAGDVKVRFAQGTSSGTATTHKINSTLWGVKLA